MSDIKEKYERLSHFTDTKEELIRLRSEVKRLSAIIAKLQIEEEEKYQKLAFGNTVLKH